MRKNADYSSKRRNSVFKKNATKNAPHSATDAMSERVTGSADVAKSCTCSRQYQDTSVPISVWIQSLRMLLLMAVVDSASRLLAWALSLIQPYLTAALMAPKIAIAITLLAIPVISRFIPFLFSNDGCVQAPLSGKPGTGPLTPATQAQAAINPEAQQAQGVAHG